MLQKLGFLPGFNKQVTSTGAESQWIDGENVRFRYGTPEKIGGWQQLGESKLTGAARGLHHFVNKASTKFAAIGTNRILYVYSGGVFYDIHPLTNPSGTAITNAFSTTNGSPTVTLTFSGSHNFVAGDIILFSDASTFSTITNSNFTATDFVNKKFMVTSVPSATTLTITMPSNESGSGATTSGGITYFQYFHVGPAEQLGAFGFGISLWGGSVLGSVATTLDGAITGTTGGNNSSSTEITLVSTTGFPSSGTNYVQIGTEEISYTGITGNKLTGIGRAARGTTAATHSNGATVTNTSSWTGWGSAAANTDSVTDPGLWSLDNLGSTLIALIHNGECFQWDGDALNATSTRATIITGAPTASRDMLVSTPDRHLVFFGTETTIGDKTTQDDMFIRFSSQENINDYVPTAENTAGTQRLAAGSRIMGAKLGRNAIYIWTDTSLFTMRFVGQPFTFAFEQVGTNCGLIGMNAAVEVDGAAYWMSDNGFFSFDGTVNTLPCSVEDYIYDDIDTTKGQQVCAGINNLFTEVTWWYPTSGSDFNNRYVVYNYGQNNARLPMGNWYTGVNTNSIRTTWVDSLVYPRPYATAYNSSNDGSFPEVIGQDGLGQTVLFEHETGTDQVNPNGSVTTLTSFIQSFSFSLQPDQAEVFLAMRRFLPNFKVLIGNNQITLSIKDYPSQDDIETSLSPFTIDSSTLKVDTRARGRYANIKIENTGVGESWRFGTFQVDIQPDGRRG